MPKLEAIKQSTVFADNISAKQNTCNSTISNPKLSPGSKANINKKSNSCNKQHLAAAKYQIPTKKINLEETSIHYSYDGTLGGFYSLVFHCFATKQMPQMIGTAAESSLLPSLYIDLNQQHALRVAKAIKKLGTRIDNLIKNIFLSCLKDKEMHLLRFLQLAFNEGGKTITNLGHELVAPLIAAEKHLFKERHLLLGFIRFSDFDGKLIAIISPKNFVLPYLGGHFQARLGRQDFLIYDKTHKAALIAENFQHQIIELNDLILPTVSEDEKKYRQLWRQFFNDIAIAARENPICQRNLLPLRYRANMTEFND